MRTAMRLLLQALLCAFISVGSVKAGTIDELRMALEQGSAAQVQEKVYVHTDNQCYFVGDTLWYKAYVVRADDLRPTDMSRTPDGHRQSNGLHLRAVHPARLALQRLL